MPTIITLFLNAVKEQELVEGSEEVSTTWTTYTDIFHLHNS